MGGHWNVSIQLQQLKKKANNWEKSQTCIAWLAGSRWIHSNLLRCLLNLVLAAPLIILPPTSVTALLKERRSIWNTGTWRNCKFSSSNFSKSFQGFLNVNSAISFPSPPFRFWNSFFLFHDSSHSVNEVAHREKTSSCQPSTSIKQVLHPPDRLPERPLQNLHILLTVCKLCANCVQTVQTGILEFCSAHVFLFFYPFCTVQFAPHTTLGAKMMRGLIRQGFSSFPIFVTPQLSHTINSPLYSDFHLHLRDRDRPAQLGCNQNLISGHFWNPIPTIRWPGCRRQTVDLW